MNRKRLVTSGFLLIAVSILLVACQAPVNQGMKVTSLEITPLKPTTGQKFTIKAEVKNISDNEQRYEIPLVVNLLVEDSRSFKLAPGTTKTLEFSLWKTELKTYKVSLGDRELTFEIFPPPVFEASDEPVA